MEGFYVLYDMELTQSRAKARACGVCMSKKNVEELLAQSASTDVQVLLTAKEHAKRAALDNPSQANLAALERASKMLESAMETVKSLKTAKDVLNYIQEQGRKVGQTKLYDDMNAGRLRKQKDGSFKLRDVNRYMQSLPMLGTSDAVADKAADRQKRKEEAEIRRIQAVADKEEFNLAVAKGKFIPKEQVYLELAARAVTLAASLKTAFEANATDMVYMVDGNPKKVAAFVEHLERTLDEALNEYSREMDIEVTFEVEQEQ